jgi:hypothetical protein
MKSRNSRIESSDTGVREINWYYDRGLTNGFGKKQHFLLQFFQPHCKIINEMLIPCCRVDKYSTGKIQKKELFVVQWGILLWL